PRQQVYGGVRRALPPAQRRADREDAVQVADRQLVRGIVDRKLETRVPERAVVLQFEAGGLCGANLRDVPQHDAAAPVAGQRAAEQTQRVGSTRSRGWFDWPSAANAVAR